MTLVDLEIDDGAAVVTLRDPAHRNAITLPMAAEIRAAFDALEADASVGGVVVTGEGRAFCAGADLDALASGDPAVYRAIYEAFLRVARCPLPTIAAINGAATGAGMNLALCCDIRLAAPRARLIARFLDIGLHPGGGHTWMLVRAVGIERAKAMVLCGEELDGAAAAAAGLVLRCVEPDALLEEATALARRAATVPRPLLERTKQTLDLMPAVETHAAAVELEVEAQSWSASLPFFHERVATLRAQISGSQSGGGS